METQQIEKPTETAAEETNGAPHSEEAEFLARIAAKNAEVRLLQSKHERDKAKASASKKLADEGVAELQDLIIQCTSPSPLFDAQAAQAEEDWSKTPLADALDGLPAGIIKSLADAQLTTVGELAEFTKDKKLTDVPGVGELKAERIEARLEVFWRARKAAAEGAGQEGMMEDSADGEQTPDD